MPRIEEAWAQFASEIGGEYVKPSAVRLGPFRVVISGDDRVVARVDQWPIALERTPPGRDFPGYTEMRARYVATQPAFLLQMEIEGTFTKLVGKMTGTKDIEVGYPDLDRAFIIKGSDESMVRALFANQRVRQLVHGPPPAYIRIGEPGKLRVSKHEIITDVAQLKSLHDLLTETLNQLVEIGAASDEAPPAEA